MLKIFVYLILCYTMGSLPIPGDNQQALASGFTYAQVDKHGVSFSYHLY